ncbi:NAD(P)-binding domain-containing protein [Pleomorphovibrio marinus]|uniref:NAD(P)-binding domain-containing protein n=1 Tax=Pleomorphovibrio marinus TaxID=2164132 RepID=UPI000E0AC2CF|nr:NAD(P)-binding domain-containing protein [Pleomorphovibrio marinus]
MQISIIGLGWIGKPLAAALQAKGHQVIGSTTSKEKLSALCVEGFDTRLFRLDPKPGGAGFEDLFNADILYINIPPSRRHHPDSYHPEQIAYLKQLAENANVGKIIYVSATSVYPSQNQVAREDDPLDENTTENPALFNAEQLLWQNKSYGLTVVRFGGLLGDNRVPGKYFAGKERVPGHPPVNYVYREDAVRAIQWIIEKGLWNKTFNVVAPQHPKKRQVYESNARQLGFALPNSYESPEHTTWKQISVEKFLSTGFNFHYPDPLEFPYGE